jgi:ketosteroid isomerase-like protein
MELTASDKLEIMELAARFELALDKEEVENYLATFVEDGILQGFWGTATGKEQLRQGFYGMLDAFARGRRHCTTNSVVRADGAEAVMESYLLVFNQGDLHRFGSAFVIDRAKKINGQWYFVSRQIDVDPSFPLLAQFQAGGAST